MTRRTINLNNAVYQYLVDHSVREHPVLAELRDHTATLPGARMQIGPEQGQFMALIARLTGAETYLEIGTYTGYSAMAMAMALPDTGRVTCCELEAEVIEHARTFWAKGRVDGKIDVVLGDATHSLDELIGDGWAGTYDLAFIDADKVNYEGYYERCLELLKPGGLIMVDNVLWSGRVADTAVDDDSTQALRAFNAARRNDERVDLSMVPIGDGLTLLRKRPA